MWKEMQTALNLVSLFLFEQSDQGRHCLHSKTVRKQLVMID